MKKYILVTYDVWGNAKEGYDINQEFRLGVVEIPDIATDKQILNILAEDGRLKSDMRKYRVEDYAAGRIEIYQRKGDYPMYGLIEMDERWCNK